MSSQPSQVLVYLKVEKVCLLSAEAGLAAVLISTVWKATWGWTWEVGGVVGSAEMYSKT